MPLPLTHTLGLRLTTQHPILDVPSDLSRLQTDWGFQYEGLWNASKVMVFSLFLLLSPFSSRLVSQGEEGTL